MLNIFISDLTEYNSGRLTGEWHDLETEEGRQSAAEAVNFINGMNHEYFISDYEADYLKIEEFSSVESLIEAGEVFENEPIGLFYIVQDLNVHNGSYDHLDVFDMEDFNDILFDYEPEQIALKVHFGDFNPTHEYFRFNAYENLESFNEYEFEARLEDEGADIVTDWLHIVHGITI